MNLRRKKLFIYEGLSRNRKKVKGRIYARNIAHARILANNRVLNLLKIKEDTITPKFKKIPILKHINVVEPLKKKEQIELFRELYSLTRIGISLNKSLKIISQGSSLSMRIEASALNIFDELEQGTSISEAFHQEGFGLEISKYLENALSYSKASEVFENVLRKIKLEEKVKRAWSSVFAYPLVMGVIIAISTIAASIYLTPLQEDMITSLLQGKEEVPPLSKFVFWMSDNIIWITAGIVILFYLILAANKKLIKKNKKYEKWIGDKINKIPFISHFKLSKEYALLSGSLAMFKGAGVSDIDSVKLAQSQVKDISTRHLLSMAIKEMESEGFTLGQALDAINFQPYITNSILRGEKGGVKITSQYLKESEEYFEEITLMQIEVLKQSTEFINTLMLYFLATPILLIALGPWFDSFTLLIGMM